MTFLIMERLQASQFLQIHMGSRHSVGPLSLMQAKLHGGVHRSGSSVAGLGSTGSPVFAGGDDDERAYMIGNGTSVNSKSRVRIDPINPDS
jgi:hypothetical protein